MGLVAICVGGYKDYLGHCNLRLKKRPKFDQPVPHKGYATRKPDTKVKTEEDFQKLVREFKDTVHGLVKSFALIKHGGAYAYLHDDLMSVGYLKLVETAARFSKRKFVKAHFKAYLITAVGTAMQDLVYQEQAIQNPRRVIVKQTMFSFLNMGCKNGVDESIFIDRAGMRTIK